MGPGRPRRSTRPSNEYQVILEVEPQYQRNPERSRSSIAFGEGALVPLDSVVKLERSVGPLSVNHFGQLPAATILFNLMPGFALGDAAAKSTRRLANYACRPRSRRIIRAR